MLNKSITMVEQPNILVVDDEPSNIELLTAFLEPYDYKIFSASNGEEAIKLATVHNIDLILLDVMMPVVSGFAVTAQLKADERTRIIPIILVTALSDKKDRIKGIESGCDDFISKPVDSCELLARVRSLLKVKAYNDHMRNYERELEIEVARRTDELYTAMALIEQTALDTIHRLAAVAEYKDEYTGFHITRMTRYVMAVANKMNLNSELLNAMLYAAPMHDIGKVGIPDRILLKPGKLDPAEWKSMKQHTIIGANILNGSKHDYMKLAKEIALTHHERWDGTGYPQGLKGEQIPVSGRIAAVADVFDALISRRPYKWALSPRESFAIIEEDSGTHFDPEVTDAFISIKDEILSIVEQYKDS